MNPSPLTKIPDTRLLSRWDLWTLAGAVALAVLLFTLWPRLPDPLPTHFDLSGHANGWTPKSGVPWAIFGVPTFIWFLILFLGRFQLPGDKAKAALLGHTMAVFRGLFGFALFLLGSLIPLVPVFGMGVFKPILGGFFALVALAVGFMVRYMNRHAPEEIKRHWKWGLFYANADDARLWVPKYLGIGWTLNFAKPLALVFMSGILAVVGTLLIMGFRAGH